MSNATIEDRFNAFCGYVHDVTGRPVLKARRGMNFQFSEPYISVDLLSCNLVPKDVVFYEDNKPGDFVAPLKATVRGLVYAVFQITSLGGADAVQIMHKLHTSFKTDRWQYIAHKNQFGLGENEGVENISAEFLSAAFENRAQMKISLYTPCPVEYEEDYFTWGNVTYHFTNPEAEMEFEYGTKPPEE